MTERSQMDIDGMIHIDTNIDAATLLPHEKFKSQTIRETPVYSLTSNMGNMGIDESDDEDGHLCPLGCLGALMHAITGLYACRNTYACRNRLNAADAYNAIAKIIGREGTDDYWNTCGKAGLEVKTKETLRLLNRFGINAIGNTHVGICVRHELGVEERHRKWRCENNVTSTKRCIYITVVFPRKSPDYGNAMNVHFLGNVYNDNMTMRVLVACEDDFFGCYPTEPRYGMEQCTNKSVVQNTDDQKLVRDMNLVLEKRPVIPHKKRKILPTVKDFNKTFKKAKHAVFQLGHVKPIVVPNGVPVLNGVSVSNGIPMPTVQ